MEQLLRAHPVIDADGKLEPRKLVTHRLHYSEIKKAYDMAYDRQKTMLGVIFDWRGV